MRFAYTKKSLKTFSKLDKPTQRRIVAFTDELESLENPRIKGKALKGELSEYGFSLRSKILRIGGIA